ncbi:MAG: hypothetical protein HC824_04450 [Synechococcales cyanobacterium RM1_1_8]|nr:hypothetical protein [Synechococcales cyanobacterium RM1_1_8]
MPGWGGLRAIAQGGLIQVLGDRNGLGNGLGGGAEPEAGAIAPVRRAAFQEKRKQEYIISS